MKQLSIRSKIMAVMLLTGLTCLGAGGMIGYRAGNEALNNPWSSGSRRNGKSSANA